MEHERGVKLVHAHVLVRGRVQGVWFRESTRQHARALGLSGWVCNRHDGQVEAVFEGGQREVDDALEFIRHGPPLAEVLEVDRVEYHAIAQRQHPDFRVTASSD